MTVALSDFGVQFADASVQASAAAPQIMPLGASVSGNALTITLGPCALAFRSTTLSNGASTVVQSGSTLSITVPSGATLGTVNGVASRLVVFAYNNAGVMGLGVCNIAGGRNFDESDTFSGITALSAGSSSNFVTYGGVTVGTPVAYRVVGYIDITQATAGTWASAPTLVQGLGGVAGESMQSLGYGQIWQSPTRAAGTTYYNTTGKPIVVNVSTSTGTGSLTPVVNGFSLPIGTCAGTYRIALSFTVPAGASYSVTDTGCGIQQWSELR